MPRAVVTRVPSGRPITSSWAKVPPCGGTWRPPGARTGTCGPVDRPAGPSRPVRTGALIDGLGRPAWCLIAEASADRFLLPGTWASGGAAGGCDRGLQEFRGERLRSQRHPVGALLSVGADHTDADLVARSQSIQDASEILGHLDRFAIDVDDHVPLTHPGFRRGTVREGGEDERPARPADPSGTRGRPSRSWSRHLDTRWLATGPGSLTRSPAGRSRSRSQADVLGVVAAGGVDPDDPACHVDQWPPRIPVVDRGVRLDHSL